MRKSVFCSLWILGLIISLSYSQVQINDYSIGKRVTLQSQILDESRDLLIHLPNRYSASTERYPVLYLLDGETHFTPTSGIVDILTGNGEIPNLIVVAIVNRNRNRDFTPVAIDTWQNSGQYDKFCRFIREDVFPYIEKNYRTVPFRILEGHSLGGMFSIHNLFTKPDMFQAHLAMSPALGYGNNYVAEKIFAQAKLSTQFKTNLLYVTVGDEPDYYPLIDSLTSYIKNQKPDGLDYEYRHFAGETHGTVPVVSMFHGLKWVFKGWNIPDSISDRGLEAIKRHHENNFFKRLGLSSTIPEAVLNRIGYRLMGQTKTDKALAVFAYNIEIYPGSANVYDSYGEGLEQVGRLKEAQTNYQKAVSVAEINNDINLEVFKQHLNTIQKKAK